MVELADLCERRIRPVAVYVAAKDWPVVQHCWPGGVVHLRNRHQAVGFCRHEPYEYCGLFLDVGEGTQGQED